MAKIKDIFTVWQERFATPEDLAKSPLAQMATCSNWVKVPGNLELLLEAEKGDHCEARRRSGTYLTETYH